MAAAFFFESQVKLLLRDNKVSRAERYEFLHQLCISYRCYDKRASYSHKENNGDIVVR